MVVVAVVSKQSIALGLLALLFASVLHEQCNRKSKDGDEAKRSKETMKHMRRAAQRAIQRPAHGETYITEI